MDLVDGSEHFDDKVTDQSPSLLTIILDTNPLAWSLFEDVLPLSSVVSNLLVFINAHLACNYTNKVAVIASHCDKAQWLYPTPSEQLSPQSSRHKSSRPADEIPPEDGVSSPFKRIKLTNNSANGSPTTTSPSSGNKYRPFRLIEAELITNLKTLLSTTPPSSLHASTSTQIAGSLTLALSYINRTTLAYNTSLMGPDQTQSQTQTNPTTNNPNTRRQSRILLISASPSTDLAHQYIPIMNAIFACQRLSIPIDILQLPLPTIPTHTTSTNPATTTTTITASPTVFLQQASDATSGIFIPFQFPPSPPATTNTNTHQTLSLLQTSTSTALLTYLLTSFLPSPSTRTLLTPPTLINVDFRAACFCHRRVIDLGYVCSICLSIFCSPPENGECLTCGNVLTLGAYGKKPIVVAKGGGKKTKKTKKRLTDNIQASSAVGTPVPTG